MLPNTPPTPNQDPPPNTYAPTIDDLVPVPASQDTDATSGEKSWNQVSEPIPRLWPNLAWDGILLIALLVWIAYVALTTGFTVVLPNTVLVYLTMAMPYVLLATALIVSMRMGAINLAVFGFAAITPLLFAVFTPLVGLGFAIAIVSGIVVGSACIMAMFVVWLRSPAWVVSGIALLIATAVFDMVHEVAPPAQTMWRPVEDDVVQLIWLGSIGLLPIIFGALGALRSLRLRFDRCSQAAADSSLSFGRSGIVLTFLGFCLSAVLAGGAGVLMGTPNGDAEASFRLFHIMIVIAVVLISGTTTNGRSGIIGTVLAVALVLAILLSIPNWVLDAYPVLLIPASLAVIGLVINGVLIKLTRPRVQVMPVTETGVPEWDDRGIGLVVGENQTEWQEPAPAAQPWEQVATPISTGDIAQYRPEPTAQEPAATHEMPMTPPQPSTQVTPPQPPVVVPNSATVGDTHSEPATIHDVTPPQTAPTSPPNLDPDTVETPTMTPVSDGGPMGSETPRSADETGSEVTAPIPVVDKSETGQSAQTSADEKPAFQHRPPTQ